jgi:hypothetical protein
MVSEVIVTSQKAQAASGVARWMTAIIRIFAPPFKGLRRRIAG